ncbi:ABC transporter permease [Fibrella forsythiae]|uniref:ABC transporter permease n=1 Tax=Fibrella forsythiae TaxID=2817061 RepID=A0ABS3JEH7_9BACT|nr:ABC transporter permease [Fibrella forsythiae]MBO0948398.1 ABC transporter permease [Fibrella forsythiae]
MNKPPRPPRWATYLLHGLCPPRRAEELEGDLDELFQQRIGEVGLHRARWRYIRDVLSLLRPSLLKPHQPYYLTYPTPANTVMLQNYVKIAWRNLLKHKLFSFINILGLSLAIPSALMALIQIVNYYEYDTFHSDSDRIVRVITDEKQKNGEIANWASSPEPLAKYLQKNLTGIDNSATIVRDADWSLSNGIKTKGIHAIHADASFFQLFNFPLEKGAYTAEPNTIVLSHETSQWFFKDANPIGNSLEHPAYGSFKIVGVLKPFNQQKTQFRTDVIVPLANYALANGKPANWTALSAHTFLKIAPGKTVATLNKQLSETSAEIDKLIGPTSNTKLFFKAQPLSDISPSKDVLENDPYVQDLGSIYVNLAFQLIMILLASLNYINLTLARSVSRSREVGVRKVMGATKPQLILQFLTESTLISYISLGIGLLLLLLIKSQVHVSWLTWDVDHLGYLILLFLVFNLILGLAAGFSPSIILSSYQPVSVLKRALSPGGFGKMGLRKSLIVIQFSIALVYIFFIGHAYHQIDYMANDNENYQRANVYTINLAGNLTNRFATDVGTVKEVQQVGYTSLNFGISPTRSSIKNRKNEAARPAFYYAVDPAFINMMQLKVVAGTNLIDRHSTLPSPMVVVNQKTVEDLRIGSEREAIGKLIVVNDTLSATIIGVVANFCHYDYERKIEPVVFQYNPSLFKVMCLKTSPVADRKSLESAIEGLWKRHNPYLSLNASWLDTDMYDRYYPYEYMQLAGLESIVIFVIAILGLIGILVYSLEKRTKEISIRKVMGATSAEVIQLMSTDFVKLLAIAAGIAIPAGIAIALYMNSYLIFNNGVSYLTMLFLLLAVIGVALGTVGFFSWKAAQTNPATTLKVD